MYTYIQLKRQGDESNFAPARLHGTIQAEKEMKEELEVKLAVSSLVCTIADNASTRRLEQGSSEVIRLEEKMRGAEVVEREGGLRAELAKTNVVVASLQAEISSVRGWQTGVDDLRLRLTSRIEELKGMVEVRHTKEQNLSLTTILGGEEGS